MSKSATEEPSRNGLVFVLGPVYCPTVGFGGMSGNLINPFGRRLLCFSLVCKMLTVCRSLFSLTLGVIGRLCSVTASLPEHCLH